MKHLIYVGLFLMAVSGTFAQANNKVCYDLSLNAEMWSRTPELLCVEKLADSESEYELSLQTGFPVAKVVATFRFELLQRVRCLDENRDLFGLSNPSNSTFNALKIQFNGKRNLREKSETGTVSIGDTVFQYRLR